MLKKLIYLERHAEDFGFQWEHEAQIIDQVKSECDEIHECVSSKPINHALLQEEVGDLLHAAFSLCVFLGFDPQETLSLSVDKFERRLEAVKALAKHDGLNSLKGKPFEELMIYWEKAKLNTTA